ncbi:MAG TPA: hypothetical protein VJA21_28685 [Verrucomicrobiae bacterium]
MSAYSLMHGGPRNVRHNFGLVLLMAAGVGHSYGSGKLYKTSVERQSEGDLSTEDLHQASLLTSQLLEHVNKAAHLLADSQTDSARSEIERAESLLKVASGTSGGTPL